jgi:CubicO group peptidase (beta-lactamase class C family)
MTSSAAPSIQGSVSDGYEPVREAFERNFTEHGDTGAALTVYVGGEKKVDLWGGVADAATGRPWRQDTLALVYSVTKGATAALCALLADRGELDVDAPVSRYWPEFAANGKEQITVRQVLSHVAGLPVIDADLSTAEVIAGTSVVEALARQKPAWEPGTRHGYHGLTFGWLIGEIVLRATGKSVGTLFASEVAKPLDLDFFIGLPEAQEARVAVLADAPPPDPGAVDAIADPGVREFLEGMMRAMSDPTSLMFRMGTSNGVLPTPSAEHWNRRDVHAVEQPAANGITNARSLAKLYASCVGEVDGVRLLSAQALRAATQEQAAGVDEVIGHANRFATGFTLQSPSLPLLSDASFGHMGAGGSLGFGDAAGEVGFGYVTNQGGSLVDMRALSLVAALREAAGS